MKNIIFNKYSLSLITLTGLLFLLFHSCEKNQSINPISNLEKQSPDQDEASFDFKIFWEHNNSQDEGRFEHKIYRNGKHAVILNKLGNEDNYNIKNKEDLLCFAAEVSNREELAHYLNTSPSLLTQIIEEVDLLRCGLDVVTIQIMQNIFYRGQNIHSEGLIDIAAYSNENKFETRSTHSKIVKYVLENSLNFSYHIPAEEDLFLAQQKAQHLCPMINYAN